MSVSFNVSVLVSEGGVAHRTRMSEAIFTPGFSAEIIHDVDADKHTKTLLYL